MYDRYAFGRLARGMPATTVAVVCVVLLSIAIVYQAITGGDGGEVGALAGPLLLILGLGLFIVLGLIMDGSANARAKTHWEEVLPVSATDFERLASGYFADHGWTAQRDDADFKVFVRRTRLNTVLLIVLAFLGVFPAVLYLAFWSLSRQEAMTVSITPVPAGARIEMIGPNAAMDGFYREIVAELPRLPGSRGRSGDRRLKAGGFDAF